MIEFRKLARSYRLDHDGRSADVWQIGGQGWAWNILDTTTGVYLASGRGLSSLDAACEAVMVEMGI